MNIKNKLLWILAVVVMAAGAAITYMRIPAPKPLPIVITISQLQVPHSGLLQIAEAKGYFSEEGLDATVKIVLTGHQAIAQVLNGDADVGSTADTPFAQALAEGKNPKLIATIFASRWSSGIIVRKDRGILQPSDLKGKRIGNIPGTNTHYDLETFLQFNDIPLESVTLVSGNPAVLAASMIAGDLDAASIWIPFITQIKQNLGDKVDIWYPNEGYAQTFNIVVRPDYVSTHRTEVDRLLRALIKAENFAINHPNEANQIIAAATGVDVSALSGHSGAFAYELTLKQSILIRIEDQVKWNYRRGFVPIGPFPDVLGAIETEPLRQMKPDSVTISK